MNAVIQRKKQFYESLEARKSHLKGLLNFVKPRAGKSTKIETMTIAAINAEVSAIEQQKKKGLNA